MTTHTQADFVIPCSQEQAKAALSALSKLMIGDHNVIHPIISVPDPSTLNTEDKIIHHAYLNAPIHDTSPAEESKWDSIRSIHFDFEADICHTGLEVWDSIHISIQDAVVFTQAVLKAFDLELMIPIECGIVSDRNGENIHGGQACVVTKEFFRLSSTSCFIQREMDAFKCAEKYYLCQFTETQGDHSYNTRLLMICKNGQCPTTRFESILRSYRGKGQMEGTNTFRYKCGSTASAAEIRELTPADFDVLNKFMSPNSTGLSSMADFTDKVIEMRKEALNLTECDRETLEKIALECCPRDGYYELGDCIDSIPDSQLISMIDDWVENE